jgi:hypothetical protein
MKREKKSIKMNKEENGKENSIIYFILLGCELRHSILENGVLWKSSFNAVWGVSIQRFSSVQNEL